LAKATPETAAATLSNTKGTPLKLSAPAGVAPLTVSRKALVTNLNAQYLSGFTFDQLAVQGGDGFTRPNTFTPIDGDGEEVASTGHLSPGTYYVTATAMLDIAPGDSDVICSVVRGSNVGVALSQGGESREGLVQAAETTAIAVTAGDTLQEWCQSGGFNGSDAANAGITAIRVLFFSGTPPALTGTSRKGSQRGLALPTAHAHQPRR